MRRKLLTLLLTAALALSLLPAAALAAETPGETADPSQLSAEETAPEPEVSFEFVEGNDVYLGPFTEGDAPLSGLSGSLHVKNTGERAIRLNYSWPRCNLTEKFLQVNVNHGVVIQPGETKEVATYTGVNMPLEAYSGYTFTIGVGFINVDGTKEAMKDFVIHIQVDEAPAQQQPGGYVDNMGNHYIGTEVPPGSTGSTATSRDLGTLSRSQAESRYGISISTDHVEFPACYTNSGTPTQEVTVTNNGSVPIWIRGIGRFSFAPQSARSFVSNSLTSGSTTLAPGDSTRFTVKLNTSKAGSGTASASLDIMLNPRASVSVDSGGFGVGAVGDYFTLADAFTVSYNVKGFESSDSEGMALSTSSLDFGTLEGKDMGRDGKKTFTITNTGNYPFRLHAAVENGTSTTNAAAEYAFAALISPSTLEPGESATVTVSVASKIFSAGAVEGKLVITATYSTRDTGLAEELVLTDTVSLKAKFLRDGGYKITNYSDDTYGKITDADGTVYRTLPTVPEGDSLTLYFKPYSQNHHIVNVYVDDQCLGPIESYTFQNVQANHILKVIFASGPAPSSWAAEQVSQAIDAEIVPRSLQSSYGQNTTRGEFCALATALYEKVKGEITERKTFSDTTDANVEKMAALGVVDGVGGGRFNPGGALTREQAATMLSRLARAMGSPLADAASPFSDNSAISSWAMEAVGQVKAAGIMDGVGNNTFSPKNSYTREQSILTALRLYNLVK